MLFSSLTFLYFFLPAVLLCYFLAPMRCKNGVLLAFSIAAPIVCRPFYYAHIGPLELEAHTGLSREEIKTAYNEMLDYCLGEEEFSTGEIKICRDFSEEWGVTPSIST